MKAMKILKMCEDKKLTAKEIFSLIHFYFKKKMSAVGSVEHYSYKDDYFEDTFIVGKGSNNKSLQKELKKYVTNFSGVFASCRTEKIRNGKLLTPLYDFSSDWWLPENEALFNVSCVVKEVDTSFYQAQVSVFSSLFLSRGLKDENYLVKQPGFSYGIDIKEIYTLIDLIAKAIRLVPFRE